LSKIQLKSSNRLSLGPRGTFLRSTQPSGFAEGGAKTAILHISENGEPLQTIAEYPVSYNKILKSTVLHWYTNWVSLTQRTYDSFYYGFSRDYKINVADSDGTGHLYVILFKSIHEKDEQTSLVDVFSKEGIYLYQMKWTFIPALIKNGFLYEVRENDDTGDVKVIRYKILNWSMIKAD